MDDGESEACNNIVAFKADKAPVIPGIAYLDGLVGGNHRVTWKYLALTSGRHRYLSFILHYEKTNSERF